VSDIPLMMTLDGDASGAVAASGAAAEALGRVQEAAEATNASSEALKKAMGGIEGSAEHAATGLHNAAKAADDSKLASHGAADAARSAAKGLNEHGEAAAASTEKLHSLARGMRYAISGALTMEGQVQHAGHAIVGVMMGMTNPMMMAAMGFGVVLELFAKNLDKIKGMFGEVATASKDAADAIIEATNKAIEKQQEMLKNALHGTREAQIETAIAGLPKEEQETVKGIMATGSAQDQLHAFEKKYNLGEANPLGVIGGNTAPTPLSQSQTVAPVDTALEALAHANAKAADKAMQFGEELDSSRVVVARERTVMEGLIPTLAEANDIRGKVGSAMTKEKDGLNKLYALLQDNVRATVDETSAKAALAGAEKKAKDDKKETKTDKTKLAEEDKFWTAFNVKMNNTITK
jgi:hypothetical protein